MMKLISPPTREVGDERKEGLLMPRASIARSIVPLFILVFAILVAACGSGTTNQQANTPVPRASSSPAATQPIANAPKAKLNLNTASAADLLTIPGMTNRMVHEFEEYRPYQSIQQFRKEMVKYVSAPVIADYEKYVYVPISENDSDAATLQQIPGLDASEAAALIAGRPYASRDAFLAKLAEKVSPDELAIAKTYLK
jgi:DNA uptake protein ComE-like DNA-binding protein